MNNRDIESSFLTNTFDLTNKAYSPTDLVNAQQFMASLLEEAYPNWHVTQNSHFKKLWHSDDSEAACNVIFAAQILQQLKQYLAKDSIPTYNKKIRELLALNKLQQYSDALFELEVASNFAYRAGPIALEPCTFQAIQNGGQPTKSPDMAIKLPDAIIPIEATTLYVGVLEKWNRSADELREFLIRRIQELKLRRQITAVTPYDFKFLSHEKKILRNNLDTINDSEFGDFNIERSNRTINIHWEGVPHLNIDANGRLSGTTQTNEYIFASSVGDGLENSPVAAATVKLTETENYSQMLLKSLRNTLDSKKEQMVETHSFILIIRLGSRCLTQEYVKYLLESRIWPNAAYNWITGIGIYTTGTSFDRTGGRPKSNLFLSFNHQATSPPSNSFIELINEGKYFYNAAINKNFA